MNNKVINKNLDKNNFWKVAKEKIENSKNALKSNKNISIEENEKILKNRAAKFAIENKKNEKEEYIEVLKFIIADEIYAIESKFIREVYPLRKFTTLPCTPEFILGIINIRGQIISIMDIRRFFNLPSKGLTNLNRVIIIKTKNIEIGILADKVLNVKKINQKNILKTLPTLTEIREEFLLGITNRQVVIIDVVKLLNDEKIIVCDQV